MYNKTVLTYLIKLIEKNDDIADKKKLAEIVKKEFDLVKGRSVYYCDGEKIFENGMYQGMYEICNKVKEILNECEEKA